MEISMYDWEGHVARNILAPVINDGYGRSSVNLGSKAIAGYDLRAVALVEPNVGIGGSRERLVDRTVCIDVCELG